MRVLRSVGQAICHTALESRPDTISSLAWFRFVAEFVSVLLIGSFYSYMMA